jgi:hypothetical protein
VKLLDHLGQATHDLTPSALVLYRNTLLFSSATDMSALDFSGIVSNLLRALTEPSSVARSADNNGIMFDILSRAIQANNAVPKLIVQQLELSDKKDIVTFDYGKINRFASCIVESALEAGTIPFVYHLLRFARQWTALGEGLVNVLMEKRFVMHIVNQLISVTSCCKNWSSTTPFDAIKPKLRIAANNALCVAEMTDLCTPSLMI